MKQLVPVFAALLFTCVSLTAHGGERVGNGGDPRRAAAHRALLFIHEAVDQVDITPNLKKSPSLDWLLEGFRYMGYREFLEHATTVWVDDFQGDDSKWLGCVKIDKISKENTVIQFAYARCWRGSDDVYFIQEIAKVFFRNAPSTQDVTDLLLSVGDYDYKKYRTEYPEDHCRYRRFPIPQGDLRNQAAMDQVIQNARHWAVDAIDRNTYSIYAFANDDEYHMGADILKSHKEDLMREIQDSPVVWDPKTDICSRTETKPNAPISLSLGQCADARAVRDFSWLLIHEAVHHLGIENEAAADSVANGLMGECNWYEVWY